MIDQTLYNRLIPVNRREQVFRTFWMLATVWFVAAICGLLLWWLRANYGWFSMYALSSLIVLTLLVSQFETSLLNAYTLLNINDMSVT